MTRGAPAVVSAIIPTLREVERVGDAVHAALRFADEVVVVDGGSDDGTVQRAQAAGARVLAGGRGRGLQLRAGSDAARGDVLVFLHVDCRLEPTVRPIIERTLARPGVAACCFRQRFVEAPPVVRSRFEVLAHLRSRVLGLHYGDSGLAVRSSTLASAGGFPDWPLFEDREVLRRLATVGEVVYLHQVDIAVSARRFATRPTFFLVAWTALELAFRCGAGPTSLATIYERLR